jgi:light-regulated signal transduction histidine kinase (bacteriophytochrome)
MNILLVDDAPSNILVLEELLAKEGRSFLKANNGKEGLKLALEKEVDLIILDVQMPDMDGFEVAQILKSNNRTRDIPIIFATATKKEHHSMLQGFEEGAVDYLFKPLDREITQAKVAILLKIQRQKKELMEKNRSLENATRQIDQLNRELLSNMEQLKTVNEDLESFSYSVSHDLRAPLRALISYSQIFQEDFYDKLDEEAKSLLDRIKYNSNRMNTLINDLLAFSKMGRKPLLKTRVDTGDLVQKVIAELPETQQHKVAFKINHLENAYGDPSLLQQVWVNLIDNAVKYSSKKDTPEIEISCTRQNDEIIFSVKDNGAGFDMKYADKLFGVFQRLHSAREFDGTGVGLATVQRIIKRHDGRIWADARENEGATFSFTLPVEST